MTNPGGTRRGARRAPRPRLRLRPAVAAALLGALALMTAWAFLVRAAIDFGALARGGRTEAWTYLGIACLGAIACLFAALMLIVRSLRTVGVLREREEAEPGRRH